LIIAHFIFPIFSWRHHWVSDTKSHYDKGYYIEYRIGLNGEEADSDE